MSLTITPNQSVIEWNSATFTLLTLTTGSNAIDTAAFQWKVNDVDITNATSSILIFPQVLASDSADYKLTYTGSISGSGGTGDPLDDIIGTSASLASHLQVNPVVTSIIVAPSLIAETDNVSVILVASSSLPMSYAWLRDGQILTPSVTTQVDSLYTGSTVNYTNHGYAQYVQGSHVVTITTNSGSNSATGLIVVGTRLGGISIPSVQYNPNSNTWYNA